MVTDDFQDPAAALVELRTRMKARRIERELNMTLLARRAGLGRTTVSQALSDSAPAPSPETVGALARALGLDVHSLLALLTISTGSGEDTAGLGRPIGDWDPHDLEVHPAAAAPVRSGTGRGLGGGSGRSRGAVLPTYVPRPHDEELTVVVTAAEAGRSQMAVLVGSSSTGKTRACWEAVRPLAAKGWRLWHPFDPTRAAAALADIERVAPRTVVWLNEAQHYFGAGAGLGERIVAAVRSLLADPQRGPVLILGTLWPEYATAYTAFCVPGREDAHGQARELLAGRQIALPDSFDSAATSEAKALAAAGDRQLAHALERVGDGRLTQYLAGAPELLRRYETASPPARCLLQAAMDARRLGVGLHLPIGFLEYAAVDYLSDDEHDSLTDNWLEQALAETSNPVHGSLAPPAPHPPTPHPNGRAADGHTPVAGVAAGGLSRRTWASPAQTHLSPRLVLGSRTPPAHPCRGPHSPCPSRPRPPSHPVG